MPMNKNSTISNLKFNKKNEDFNTSEDKNPIKEMPQKIADYLDYIEENGAKVCEQTVFNVINFSKSYRVLKSKSIKNVELILN